jgi:hypothetical protein
MDIKPGHAIRTYNMDIKHGHATWKCNMDMKNRHAARTCSMDMDMLQGYAAWTWTCCKDMLHGHSIITNRRNNVDILYNTPRAKKKKGCIKNL